MNLAIHDLPTFRSLCRQGHTGDWAERGIVAWVPAAMARENPSLRDLAGTGGVTIHIRAIDEEEVEIYEAFRCGLASRFAESEVRLLFHAEQTSSVLLTRDGVMREFAQGLGLACWSGDTAALDAHFPRPGEAPEKKTAQNFPTRRQVPDRDELGDSRSRTFRDLDGSRTLHETLQ
jgi:hypothetical protein